MGEYNAKSIVVLEGLEAVRKRPGMYIGGTDQNGFHHLLWEIVDNSVDEAIAGHATEITIDLGMSSASVTDNGRGIPWEKHPKTGKSTLDVIFTTLHAGGKFDSNAYKTSGGLHGVGSSVVNALSSELIVSSSRDKAKVTRKFSRGSVVGRIKKEKISARKTGTEVYFEPDKDIFGDQKFNPGLVYGRLQVKAYLTPGVKFILNSGGDREEFLYEGGLSDYLADTVSETGDSVITDTPFFASVASPRVEVALAWTDSSSSHIISFANGIPTQDGGTHAKGLDAAVVSIVRSTILKSADVPKRLKITPDDIREGILGFVSVFVEEPQFQGQTKDRLNNPEVKKVVEDCLEGPLTKWMHDNSEQSKRLAHRIVQAARARQAARDASFNVKRSTPVSRLRLPGKLADCSSNCGETTELFLVEGDSAGGSAKQGRDRAFQAILPLRGKVLNSIEVPLKKVLQNEELRNIVEAIGTGIASTFDLSKKRYGKIILLMDADSDGHHITTLLLSFFYRHMPEIISAGILYLSVPPLYRIDMGNESFWAKDDDELEEVLSNNARKIPQITRFKGLGEMPPDVLKSTTLDPENRVLQRVEICPGDEIITEFVMTTLLGRDSSARYDMLSTCLNENSGIIDI